MRRSVGVVPDRSGGRRRGRRFAVPGAGTRPGPDILYEPLANAPQLQNTGNWSAPPILVSGASAYRNGEFLYQDFLYDDHGANGSPRPERPAASPATRSPRPTGTYTYPTDPVYANNAADLVELRVKPLADRDRVPDHAQHAQRTPSLSPPRSRSATRPAPRPFPHGANVSAPAQLFLTVHGSTATSLDAATGQPVAATPPSVSVDMTRRQITVLRAALRAGTRGTARCASPPAWGCGTPRTTTT